MRDGSAGFRLCCPDAVNTFKRRSWQDQITDSFIPQVLKLAGLHWKVP